jgi:pimeloyl-ACP methyl ester carboxylesterase
MNSPTFEHRYESDGAQLSYLDSGAGMPVVFLHPTPLDHDYWRPLLDELSGALPGTPIRAIVPDLRGHGKSELGSPLPVGEFARVPDAPVLTMEQLARDILVLLDTLGLIDAVFVGCSIGGYVMLELWRHAAQRMRGLAFVCSKPQPDAEPALIKRAANIAIARESGVTTLFDGMVQVLIGESTRARRPEVVSECRSRMTLTPETFIAVQAGLATRPDSLPTVVSITQPVLAIAGGEDSAVAAADMEAFGAAPGGCDYRRIHDAGHLAAYEQPQRVARLLAQWLPQFESQSPVPSS